MNYSKQDTNIAKGVSILMLIAYHSFSTPDRLQGCDVSFFPLPSSRAFAVFESMNICVGMFAFLSAYGLTRLLLSRHPNLSLSSRESAAFVTRRTVGLLGAFFLPYLMGMLPSLLIFGRNPYGKGAAFVLNLLADACGLAELLGTRLMVGSWWYMSFALVIIWLMPFTVSLYRRYSFLCLVPYAVLPVLFLPKFPGNAGLTNMTRWLLTIPLGVIVADARLFERWKSFRITDSRRGSRVLKFLLLTALLALLFALRRSKWSKEHFYYYISSLLPVLFLFYLYEFVHDIPALNRVLAFFGVHSSNIFFLHTYIRAIWFPKLTYSFGHAGLTYLFLIVTSLALSYAVMALQRLLCWDRRIKAATELVLKQQERLFAPRAEEP